jgi:hypothetical protein
LDLRFAIADFDAEMREDAMIATNSFAFLSKEFTIDSFINPPSIISSIQKALSSASSSTMSSFAMNSDLERPRQAAR